MAILSPPIGEVERLTTRLNPGEARVLKLLRRLDDDWHVFVQPRIRMDQPDFVVVHARYGVCVVEVKDWQHGIYRQAPDGSIEVETEGRWVRTSEVPRLQAHRYRRTLFENFFASPGTEATAFRDVRGVVILPQHPRTKAQQLLQLGRERQEPGFCSYIQVEGMEALDGDPLDVVADHRDPESSEVSSVSVGRLLQHLAEPAIVADQRRPLILSDDARNLEANPRDARMRRARGPAGCGKSLGLAARAARLAQSGGQVLVLSFNITLPHYLHDLAARHGRQLGVSIRNIRFTHFHDFCWRAIQLTSPHQEQALEVPHGDGAKEIEDLVERAARAYAAGHGEQFDAILVDEGQDFQASWWNFLRKVVLKNGGEMLLVADTTQDLYGRAGWTTEESMLGCGFSGDWTELRGCYRLPPDLAMVAQQFGAHYVTDGSFDPPAVPEQRRRPPEAWTPTARRWTNLGDMTQLGPALAREVQVLRNDHGVKDADIVFLVEEHRDGLLAADILDGAGVYVSHVFTRADGDDRRKRKRRFWGGGPGVKGCTVQSFKGWEARGVVLCILPKPGSRRLAYVAMTRVHGVAGEPGAVVSVINCDPELNSFQTTFERIFSIHEVPALGGQRRLL